MKRYFIAPPGTLPHELPDHPHVGEYHYIDLDDGTGNRTLVMMDDTKEPYPAWEEMPSVLDAAPPPGQLMTKLASMPALDTSQNTYQIAQKLAAIMPPFKP